MLCGNVRIRNQVVPKATGFEPLEITPASGSKSEGNIELSVTSRHDNGNEIVFYALFVICVSLLILAGKRIWQ